MNHSRIISIDIVKAISIFAVVILHTMPFFGRYIWIGNGVEIGVIVNQLSRFAVPYFFVISGFFWGQKTETKHQLIQNSSKMAKRLFLAFIAWTLIYTLPTNIGDAIQHGNMWAAKTIYWNFSALASNPLLMLMEGSKDHLWFLPALLCCLGISSILVFYDKTKILIVLSIALYFVGIFGKSYSATPTGFYSTFNFRNGPFFGLIFFTTGHLLSKLTPQHSWLSLGSRIASAGFILHFFELFLLSSKYDENILPDYLIGTYFIGSGVAISALSNHVFFQKLKSISKIGPFVFGIYTAHYIFLDLLLPLNRQFHTDILWGFAYPILIFALSAALAYAMSSVRFTRPLVL